MYAKNIPKRKRLLALVLAVALLLSVSLTASAKTYYDGDSVPIYLDFTTLVNLEERDAYGFPWMATEYCVTAENGSTLTTSGDWLYCIDYYNHAQQGLVNSTATNLFETAQWDALSTAAKFGITHALIYGGANYSNEFFGYAATQLIIWEYQMGLRTNPTQSVTFFATTLSSNTRLRNNYDGILSVMSAHFTPPSFSGSSITLRGYGKENGVTVTDNTKQLANDTWRLTSGTGIHIEQSGNDLLIWADEALASGSTAAITLQRNLKVATGNAVCAISGAQTVIIGVPPDPVVASLNVTMEAGGSATGAKTSPTGDVEGYCFKIYSWAQNKTWYAKTDAEGVLRLSDSSYSSLGSATLEDLLDGDYTFLEVLSQKGAGLVFPESWQLTVTDAAGNVVSDQTYTAEDMTVDANGDCRLAGVSLTGLTGEGKLTMTIRNAPVSGNLKIVKTSTDGIVEGVKFNVYRDALDEDNLLEGSPFVTNASGEILVSDLTPGTYVVEEVVTGDYFSVEPQTVTVTSAHTADNPAVVTFENVRRAYLQIIKTSSDDVVSGIQFNVYRDSLAEENLLEGSPFVTDATGRILVTGLTPGVYVVEELVPGGYLPVEDQTVRITTFSPAAVVTFENVRKCFAIKIIKTSAGTDIPLPGAVYIVETYVPENVTCTVNPFFVSLPMTTVDGSEWNYDVTLYPKNETGNPTLEKTVREAQADTGKTKDYAHTATASVGDVVEYQIVSRLPAITSSATYLTTYTFVDTLSKGITYNKEDVVITWYRDAAMESEITSWAEDSGKFAVAYGTGENESTTMTISMTDTGLAEINPAYSECYMVITYACTLNEDAILGDSGNPNEVELTWKRTNTSYYDTLKDCCHVYSYGVDLSKKFRDADNQDVTGNFANVKFVLRNDTDSYFVKADLVEGVYYVTDHVATEAEATTLVADEDGKIVIWGLEDDVYYLKETSTDSGFQLLAEEVKIEIVATESSTLCGTCGAALLTASGKVNDKEVTMLADGTSVNALAPLTVINNKGFDLPATGSTGTWLMSILGVIGMAACALCIILLFGRKRKEQA